MPYSHRFVFIAALFVTVIITSNILAVKLIEVAGLVLPAAIILFPIGYIVGDVLTEVYGYSQTRRVIWMGFVLNIVAVTAIWVSGSLPAAEFWDSQEAWDAILGQAPRILAASFIAYLIGEFANAYVLAKIKIATAGKMLWLRTISSTIVGQGLDSAVFITLAFAGIIPGSAIISAILAQWFVKSAYEAMATPVTYGIIKYLKKAEGIDFYDTNTKFSPLTFLD